MPWLRGGLKALLTKRQLEFPKTHEIRRLLELLNASDHAVSEALPDAKWLDPFGVEIRYPSDRPETDPGDGIGSGRAEFEVTDSWSQGH